ncbi:Mo-dependent nitrogenase C-terminal domain-containing protein [Acaryochloris sp. CCMEE 5410]
MYFQSHKLFQLALLGKFNPAEGEVIMLRFQLLSYLANQCSKDINRYIY